MFTKRSNAQGRRLIVAAFLTVGGALLTQSTQAQSFIYATNTFEEGTGSNWVNLPGSRSAPSCTDCACPDSACSRNATATGGGSFRWLVADAFQGYSRPAGQAITQVLINVQGRYATSSSGGSFNVRIRVRGSAGNVVFEETRTTPTFSSNSNCRWRMSSAVENITSAVNWNSDPGYVNRIELAVNRNGGNTTTLCIDAFRVTVSTAPDFDEDGTPDSSDPDIDADGVTNGADSQPYNRFACADVDGDACDDCTSGSFNTVGDGPDFDADGRCDNGDPDIDNDGRDNGQDSAPYDRFRCSDTDGDGCDDCSNGAYNPANDGADLDSDGRCDSGDGDIDNDGRANAQDAAPFDRFHCADTDGDGCDDCSSGVYNPFNDGADLDSDGRCDSGDANIDGDGELNVSDWAPYDPARCRDVDHDGCDDCDIVGCSPVADSDADGLPDPWESYYPAANDSGLDSDGDGLTNYEEYYLFNSNPLRAPLYVDGTNTGGPWSGSSGNPYRTVIDAFNVATTGDTILIRPGAYSESFPLYTAPSWCVLRSTAGPDSTTIDLSNQSIFLELDGLTILNGRNAVRGGASRNCILTGCAPALEVDSGRCLLSNVTLRANGSTGAASHDNGSLRAISHAGLVIQIPSAPLTRTVEILGILDVADGFLAIEGVRLFGTGQLRLGPTATLQIEQRYQVLPGIGIEQSGPTSVSCGIVGTGTIIITANATLQVLPGGVIDLRGDTVPGDCSDPSQATQWGHVIVRGALELGTGTLQNANVRVEIGRIMGNRIVNNNCRIPRALEPGPRNVSFGGEFFVSGNSVVQCNAITSDGDRYLDFDPDPSVIPRPTIGVGATRNTFYVNILQGAQAEQGELLELRSVDRDAAVGGGLSGAHHLASSAGDTAAEGGGYNERWAFERLEIYTDAKVNLTNRPGFVFQPSNITTPEALYVKQLKLHAGAVLNTGLQRCYYQTLVDEFDQPLTRNPSDPAAPLANGARIVDQPLLGFSLKVIALEDQTEFDVRVRPRLTDPADPNPPISIPPTHVGQIARIAAPLPPSDELPAGDPTNHAMRMLTREPGKQIASSVAAHGAFARAGDEDILIQFDYRFCGGTNPQLIVYLSDQPEARDASIPVASDPHVRQVAIVTPPAAGRPGSAGDPRFARFYGIFARNGLNFTRGTYVELELRGGVPGTPADVCVEIDNWDPQIECGQQCGDLTGNEGVNNADWLVMLSQFGKVLGQNTLRCLDARVTGIGLCGDGYVDSGDLLSLDDRLGSAAGTYCQYAPNSTPNGASVNLSGSGLLIAGKPTSQDTSGAPYAPDRLYPMNASAGTIATPLNPASYPSNGLYRGNGRLLTDASGALHQLHASQGVLRLSDGQPVLRPGSQPYGAQTVFVGPVNTFDDSNEYYPFGRPLFDAAFSRTTANELYVVPVVVRSASGSYYKAAAKLTLAGDGSFSVAQLYGPDPANDPQCTNASPPEVSACSIQDVREVEVDASGNVFVISAMARSSGNDWLLVYPPGSQMPAQRILLTDLAPGLRSPSQLLVSSDGNWLYLTSAADTDYQSNVMHVYRFAIQRNGASVSGVTLNADLLVSPPSDLGTALPPFDCNGGSCGYVATLTALAEVPASGAYGTPPGVYGLPAGTLVALGALSPNPDYETLSITDTRYLQLFTAASPTGARGIRATLPAPGQSGAVTATFLPAPTSGAGPDATPPAWPVSAAFYSVTPAYPLGDMNCDSAFNNFDIDPFVQAILDAPAWQTQHPGCPLMNGDMNHDNAFNNFDIDAFVNCLIAGGCP